MEKEIGIAVDVQEMKPKTMVIGHTSSGMELAHLTRLMEDHPNIHVVDLSDLEQDHKAMLDRYSNIPITPLPQLSMFGSERPKKKPCTFHEYTLQETIKDEYAGGSIQREVWKCRHCSHPLK